MAFRDDVHNLMASTPDRWWTAAEIAASLGKKVTVVSAMMRTVPGLEKIRGAGGKQWFGARRAVCRWRLASGKSQAVMETVRGARKP